MFARVYYDLETDGEGHYFMTFNRIENEDNQSIIDQLPVALLDEMDSFSFDTIPLINFHTGIEKKKVSLIQQIAHGIYSQWEKVFASAPFIPVLLFNKLDVPEKTKLIPIIIFFGTTKQHNRDAWCDVLIKTSKFFFYDSTSWTATSDHQVAFRLLKRYDYRRLMDKQQSDKYNLVSRMHHWYKNETSEIIDAAQAVIHEFVAVKKFNTRIPGFLVVPAFHISRYRKAMQLLIDKYAPSFIMTLPLVHDDAHWTIMFPVIGNIYPPKKAENVDTILGYNES